MTSSIAERLEKIAASMHMPARLEVQLRELLPEVRQVEADNADLRHDIERHIEIATEHATERARLEAREQARLSAKVP